MSIGIYKGTKIMNEVKKMKGWYFNEFSYTHTHKNKKALILEKN